MTDYARTTDMNKAAADESLSTLKARCDTGHTVKGMTELAKYPLNSSRFDPRKGIVMEKPVCVGEYCRDRDHIVTPGRMHAKYLHMRSLKQQRVSYDMNLGFESFVEKGEEHLDNLLSWIIEQGIHGTENDLHKVVHEAQIVSWRGLLTRIAATPFCGQDSWCFVALKRNGVVFLCEEETDQAKRRKETMTHKDKLMTYWGHKFEQYITTSSQEAEPETSEPVSCYEEFTHIVKTSLDATDGAPLRLLYAGEVDCIDDTGDLVELKTQKGAMEGHFWKQKSLKWYLQSFLLGIRRIVVGFRNDNGIVERLSEVRTSSLPQRGQWSPNVALQCLSTVLTNVRALLTQRDAIKVFFDGKNVTFTGIEEKDANFLSLDFNERYKSS